ncbi:MAG: P-loop NTPase fold protein, partial [Propionicimonas sp.]|nr:P-loop NTPase fold protein [Propionicimonas sp.]
MASSHPNGELIEDREIAKLDEDRLGHSDVVAQLAQLVTSVPTPSNVALYGAWGSGKSGVGRLLEEALRQRSDVRFARFDAFKYAQNPLRRNFVSVVASALNQRASKYHEDLYRGRVDTDFHVPFTKLAKL